MEKAAAEKAAAEKAAPAKAAALGLLQPLEALSLDAETLRAATVAAVAFCDAQGASSVADLVERASKLTHPQNCRALGFWLLSAPYRRRVAPAALLRPVCNSQLACVSRDSHPLQQRRCDLVARRFNGLAHYQARPSEEALAVSQGSRRRTGEGVLHGDEPDLFLALIRPNS